jgi:DHA1 family tetracycline resistance protein-like MFS transporter
MSISMQTNKTGFLSLLPLYMVILLDVMGVVLILPVLTPLILQVDGSILPAGTSLFLRDVLYGFALAVFPLFMFFSTPILGDLSDKFGRKKILLLCLFAGAISYLISAIGVIMHSLFVLILGRVIAGLAAGTQPIASAAIIDFSDAHTKTRNLGWIVLVSSIGIIIGPLVGGITSEKSLISWFGYETPFLVASVLALLNAIYLYFSYAEIAPIKSKVPVKISKGFVLFIAAFTEQKFRLLSFTYFSFILAWSLYFQAISWFFMQNYQYSSGKLGLFIGYIGVVFVIATTFIVHVAMKFFDDEMKTFLFFVALMAIANIGCAFSTSELSQWLWVILNATSNVICYTVSLSLFSNLAGKDSQGWIMGVAGSLAAITWTVGGVIAGPLGYLDIRVPLLTAGIFCIISFVLMLLYQRTHHNS